MCVSRVHQVVLTGRGGLLKPRNQPWILAVEDSESDSYLFQRAIAEGPAPEEIVRAADGEKAIALLQELAPAGAEAHPDLIVIDVNLPRLSGYEVLEHLTAQKVFGNIPVVVVTSSQQGTDRKRALTQGADAFFVKPLDLASYRRLPDIIAEARRARANRAISQNDAAVSA